MTDRVVVNVTFNPDVGYVGTSPELQQAVTALSLGGLRRRIEALMLPDEPIIVLSLDRDARRERDRRRSAMAKV